MSSVQFLRFPSSIQHRIVRKMNLRELVKFSFCSKRTHRAVKSAKSFLYAVDGDLRDQSLDLTLRNMNDDGYEISINPYEKNDENNKGPEYIGFEGLRMYDYTETIHIDVLHTGIVIVPEHQDFLEICDRLMGYVRNLFVGVRFANWILCPIDPQYQVILKKHFPKVHSFEVYPSDSSNHRQRITKEDIQFFLEQFEVTDFLWIISEAEEGYLYSKGFQQETVHLNYPSWVHWNAILNSTSRWIDLVNVRTLSSSDLNRLLKLWVSNEKLQSLTHLDICLVRQEGLEFPPDFLEFALEGIRNYDVGLERWREIDEVDPGQSMQRKIRRVDGKMATVKVIKNTFYFRAF